MGLRRGRSEYHKAELFSCPVFGSQEALDQSWEERNGGIQHSARVVWSRGAAHPMQAKLMNSFSDHGNSHGLGIKEPLLCWTRAELQGPLVCLSHLTGAMRTLLEDAEPWPPLLRKGVR